MIREPRASGRMELTVLLSAMAVLCFSMSLARYLITDSRLFLFLNRNLFLAFLPWPASSAVVLKPHWKRNRIIPAAHDGLDAKRDPERLSEAMAGDATGRFLIRIPGNRWVGNRWVSGGILEPDSGWIYKGVLIYLSSRWPTCAK